MFTQKLNLEQYSKISIIKNHLKSIHSKKKKQPSQRIFKNRKNHDAQATL